MTIQLVRAVAGVLLLSSAAATQSPMDRILTTLSGKNANTFWIDLDQSRPPAVLPEFKAAVLAALPAKGEIRNLKESARRKLAAAQEILRMHQRDAVYEVKVIDVPNAFVGLHARSVLVISETALNLLT